MQSEMRLFSPDGKRLYTNDAEKARLIETARKTLSPEYAAYFELLALTGARISEGLAVKASDINLDGQDLTFRTLKKRRDDVFRVIPLPGEFVDRLQATFNLRKLQNTKRGRDSLLWPYSRQRIQQVSRELFDAANLEDFSPKALRHGFAVSALGRGLPLTLVSEMMGHSSLEVTAIYARAMNAEKRALVARMWD